MPAREHRDVERANFDFFLGLPEIDRTQVRHDQVKGVAQLQPLFEFSLACSGLRRDARTSRRSPSCSATG